MNPLLDALSSVKNPNLADLEDIGRIPPKALIDALVTQGANLAGLPMDMAYLAQSGINKGMDLLGVPNPYPLGELKDTVMTSDWMADKAGVDTESIPYLVNSMLTPDPSTALKFGPLMQAMTVFHGSPHKWDRVDLSKVGTGEGAQAFGHGFYAAENPKVAGSYRFVDARIDPDNVSYDGKSIESLYDAAQKKQTRGHRLKDEALIQEANAELKFWEDLMVRNHPDQVMQDALSDPEDWPELTNFVRSISRDKFTGVEEAGNLYELDLPDETIAKMLDWDKPLSEQPESVRKALDKEIHEQIAQSLKVREGFNAKLRAAGKPEKKFISEPGLSGKELYAKISKDLGGDKAASDYLNSLGIPGIKYLDGTSRSAGDGTRNFVIFDEQYITPLKRNGEPIIKDNP